MMLYSRPCIPAIQQFILDKSSTQGMFDTIRKEDKIQLCGMDCNQDVIAYEIDIMYLIVFQHHTGMYLY